MAVVIKYVVLLWRGDWGHGISYDSTIDVGGESFPSFLFGPFVAIRLKCVGLDLIGWNVGWVYLAISHVLNKSVVVSVLDQKGRVSKYVNFGVGKIKCLKRSTNNVDSVFTHFIGY